MNETHGLELVGFSIKTYQNTIFNLFLFNKNMNLTQLKQRAY